jgi:uncharacterized repeat protein (TIGR02543 family)
VAPVDARPKVSSPNPVRGTPSFVLAVAGILLLSGLALGVSIPASSTVAGVGALPHVRAAPAGAPSSTLDDNATFFTNGSVPEESASNVTCDLAASWCWYSETDPSALSLPNGGVAVTYNTLADPTISSCSGAAGNSTIAVGVALSSTDGQSFQREYLIGDPSGSACPYFNALEPSFAVGGSEVYGTYVMTDAGTSSLLAGGFSPPIVSYTDRNNSALAFVDSTNNATSFSAPRILPVGAFIARPALAAFGQTVYIVFENISNGTTPVPSGITNAGTSDPISLEFIRSTDGGSTWTAPRTIPGALPGGAPAEFNTTFSPAVAVSSTGALAVAYTANRSCVAFCGSSPSYGDDIVEITSTNNGTTWSPIHVIARGAGEDTIAGANGYTNGQFEQNPSIALAWGTTSPDSLYVAYAATYNISIIDNQYSFAGYDYDWSRSDVFASTSTNSGGTWSTPVMAAPPLRSADDFQNLFGENYVRPGLGVSPSGTVYLTYTYNSWTNGACGYLNDLSNGYPQSNAQFLETSTNGTQWDPSGMLSYSTDSAGINYLNYDGYTASVAFASSGAPVVAYSLPTEFLGVSFPASGGVLYYSSVDLDVATPYVGPTTNVTLEENGVPSGQHWTGEVGGVGLNTTASSVTLTQVPTGVAEFVTWPSVPVAGPSGSAFAPIVSVGPQETFSSAATIFFNFSDFFPVTLGIEGPGVPPIDLALTGPGPSGAFYITMDWYTYSPGLGYPPVTEYEGCPMPQFFPAGFPLVIGSATDANVSTDVNGPLPSYWTGTGNGSYSGPGPIANLTVNGPLNETMWFGGAGSYTIPFSAPDLPSNSTYRFTVNNTAYSAAGGTSVEVPLATGAYPVTGISASSTLPGYEYFGSIPTGNPVVVPETPSVQLLFASVDVGSPAGKVTFQANGLSPGTVWQLSVNGTQYSSSGSDLNVTLRSGTYPVDALPVVLSNGTEQLAPTSFGPELNVTTGGTYSALYVPQYRVQTISTVGSSSPGLTTQWLAGGATRSITAAPAISGYAWAGWSGSGSGSYSGNATTAAVTAYGPIQEIATYTPLPANVFNITVHQSGVPTGSSWSVLIDGKGYASTGATLVIPNLFQCTGGHSQYVLVPSTAYANGTTGPVRYVPGQSTVSACGGSQVSLTFDPQDFVSWTSTSGGSISVSGLPSGSGVASAWVGTTTSLAFNAQASTGYTFLGWTGSGTGSVTSAALDITVVVGGPIVEVAAFTAVIPPTSTGYTLTISAGTTLPSGTDWSVTVGSTTYASSAPTLVVPGLAGGTYPLTAHTVLAADDLTEFDPSGLPGSVVLHANETENVTFATNYWLSVSAAGPGSTTPASGWHAAGTSVALEAIADPGASFVGWVGSGAGNSSATDANTSVTINGPIHEVASFAPEAPVAVTPTSALPFLATPAGWAVLALVGIVVGVLVGVLLSRRGRPGVSAVDESAAPPPAEGGSP